MCQTSFTTPMPDTLTVDSARSRRAEIVDLFPPNFLLPLQIAEYARGPSTYTSPRDHREKN
jgi:hypothetical protein